MYQIVGKNDNPPMELVKEAVDTVEMLQRRYGKNLTAGGSKQNVNKALFIVFLNWAIYKLVIYLSNLFCYIST